MDQAKRTARAGSVACRFVMGRPVSDGTGRLCERDPLDGRQYYIRRSGLESLRSWN